MLSAGRDCTDNETLSAGRVSKLPSLWATGVFRAATDVAAAPPRGANPPFATEGWLGVGLCVSFTLSVSSCHHFATASNASRSRQSGAVVAPEASRSAAFATCRQKAFSTVVFSCATSSLVSEKRFATSGNV